MSHSSLNENQKEILKKYIPNWSDLEDCDLKKHLALILQKNIKNQFLVTTSASSTQKFDAVIIASGASARWLGIDGEERFISKGYHSCATCDGFFYRNKVIAVVGGGDTAMEEANFLTKFAKTVYLIHRSNNFKASKIMLDRVKSNPKIELLVNKQVVELIGENNLQKIVLEDTVDNSKQEMILDGLFVAIGHIPNTNFVQDLSIDKDELGYLIPQLRVPAEDRTSNYDTATKINGIFVAGDVEDKTYRQAITAAADGCKAAIDCEKWLED